MKRQSPLKLLILLVSPAGFEPTAPGLGILCSILLSYGDFFGSGHNLTQPSG